jgi:hypothetical protein
MFSILYHGLLRISEITHSHANQHNLLKRNIKVVGGSSPRTLHIEFQTYKHSRSNPKPLSVSQADKTCPVTAYIRWVKIRPEKATSAFTYPDGKSVRPAFLRRALNDTMTYLQMDSSQYNTHSFRIGKATDMYKQGFSDAQISVAGRWNSQAYKKYIKPHIIRL